jgi:predicted nucleic acid-binding protein
MDFLVDTNVFSEQLKRTPDAAVLEWLRENESKLFVSTITIAEIRRGIESLGERRRREEFESWLAQIGYTMKGSILSFNRSVAHVWGQMQGKLDTQGIRLSAFDGLIAATAVRYDLTVVTRNTRDFENAPVRLLNPVP